MKKLLIITSASIFTIGCSNQAALKDNTAAAPATTKDYSAEKIDNAYLPYNHPAD
ncbi:MAG TPA: hypothetical protein VKI61_05005 [Chitinophagaceae bacterium]|nr:hypothetical protein [Chitinophagaceae bacterium]